MSIQSVGSLHSSVYSLDEILQDIPETATEELLNNEKTYQNYKEELNEELKTTDRVWLEFHVGLCKHFGNAAKSILYRIVKSSVGNPENSIAASNAITILKVMRISFSCLDLQGVQIPSADLSSGILDEADLSGANLENANLTNASLNGTKMPNVNLKYVKFDIPNIFFHKHRILSSIVSPDNKYLISEDIEYMYFWHLPSKTCIKKITVPNRSVHYLKDRGKIFTPDGRFLLIYDGKQYVDILAVGSFEYIQRLKISDEVITNIRFSFSSNGNHFITNYRLGSNEIQKFHLKIWDIEKTENNLLDIHLKSEAIVFNLISDIYFSKKFPIFYYLKAERNISGVKISLSIWDTQNLAEIENILNIDERYGSVDLLSIDLHKFIILKYNAAFSLGISATSKNNEEHIFFAVDDSIYDMNILGKNGQNWALESTQVTKVITEIDDIHDMRILEKMHELIYVCNNAICLYNLKNNQIIGRFRILDIGLKQLPVSFNEKNIYIGYLRNFFIYSIEALKDSKHISYEICSRAACFSPSVNSIISLSSNFYKQIYDIETGILLKSSFLKKMNSHISNQFILNILFSPNAQHILFTTIKASVYGDDYYYNPMRNFQYGHTYSSQKINSTFNLRTFNLHIINSENEEVYFKDSIFYYAISNNSDYLMIINNNSRLGFYKNFLSNETIEFGYSSYDWSIDFSYNSPKIALSTNFHNNPRIALIKESGKINIYNFSPYNILLKKLSQQEFSVPIEENNILQLMFTENNSKIIVVSCDKVIILDIDNKQHEEYSIQASCVDIARDGSLLIYYNENDKNIANHQLCLWSVTKKKLLIVQTLSLAITNLQISSDNRYIIGTVENGGIYVWKIFRDSFRLLWRTSHNLQVLGLILGNNNLEKDVEEDLIAKMGAIKL